MAWAQPTYQEGPGVRLGDGLVLHPGIALEPTIDSNVFYESSNESPVSAPYLRVLAHIDLATPSPQRGGGAPGRKVDFRLRGGAGLRNYFSDNEAVKQQNAVDVEGDLRLTFNPGGTVSFGLYDNFQRLSFSKTTELPDVTTRDVNTAGAQLVLEPGGGALSTVIGYSYTIDIFEDQPEPPPGREGLSTDRNWHTIGASTSWKFLPKTTLSLDLQAQLYDKKDESTPPDYLDTQHYRGYFGIATLLTPTVSLQIRPGFGIGAYEARPATATSAESDTDFAGPLLVSQLGLRPSPMTRLAVGYDRDFADSVVSNYYVDNTVYFTFQQRVGTRVSFNLRPAVRFRTYEGLTPTVAASSGGGTTREDTIVEGSAGLDFRVNDWFFLGASYQLTIDNTDFVTDSDPADDVPGDEGEYTKHVTLAKIELAY